jgi:N-acetylglucosaminyl-diphospho-decaprenol L-rhamnosyltransferase
MSAPASERRPTVGVVTVTYASGRFLQPYLEALAAQTHPPDEVVLVDSGSPDRSYLDRSAWQGLNVTVLREANVGFAVGSNLGWKQVRGMDYVLFLNPDAFLQPTFLEKAVAYLETEPRVGMVTPTLERFSMESMQPLGRVDTTGVVRSRLGLLGERDDSQPVGVLQKYTGPNDVPWVCAAAVLCRREALEGVSRPGEEPFDESFFMYKEDTDLAWRIRRAGWRLVHHPELYGYHCRGWQDRKGMSRTMRLMTARNEVRMCLKNGSPFVLLAAAKWLLIQTLNL